MNKFKKITALFLMAVMVITVIPISGINAKAITTAEIKSKLDSFMVSYPSGSKWTGSFDGSTGCYGFAGMVVYNLFGKYSSDRYHWWNYAGVSTSGMNNLGSVTSFSEQNVKGLLNNARVGDVLQFDTANQHSMIVYSVENDGVYVYDCNWNGDNTVSLRKCSFGAWEGRNSNKLTLLRAEGTYTDEYENTYTNTGNQRVDIIGVAKTQLGYIEGSNNDTKYGSWYGLPNQPWCAMFITWCARQANIPASVLKSSAVAAPDPQYFNIPYYDGEAYTPRAGDLFFTKSWSHVGLVYYVDGEYFYTIEGNSNTTGSSEGICVCTNRRKTSEYYFGVPAYSESHSVDGSYGKNFTAYPKAKITSENIFDANHISVSSTAWIGITDLCTIHEVYTDGCCYITYPLDAGGTASAYSKIELFNIGHTHSYKEGFEAEHPHRIYMQCSTCGERYYTGENKTVSDCAECNPVQSDKAVIKINSVSTVCGNQIVLPVTVENTSLSVLTIEISYDKTKLELVSVDGVPFGMSEVNINTPGLIQITGIDSDSVPQGSIAGLTFNVIATDSCSTDISLNVSEAFDGDDNAVSFSVVNSTVSISKTNPGDVNGDGKVSAIDARWILQATVGIKTLTEAQKAAADVNGDGKVSAIDARKILKIVVGTA